MNNLKIFFDITDTLEQKAGIPEEISLMTSVLQQSKLNLQTFVFANTKKKLLSQSIAVNSLLNKQKKLSKLHIILSIIQALKIKRVHYYPINPNILFNSDIVPDYLVSPSIQLQQILVALNRKPYQLKNANNIFIFQGLKFIKPKGHTQIIVRYHDSFPLELPYTSGGIQPIKQTEYFIHNIAPFVWLCCNSNDTKKRLLNLNPFLKKNHISVIYPPLNKLFKKQSTFINLKNIANRNHIITITNQEETKQINQILDSTLYSKSYLFCVSRFEPRKNLDKFIKAYSASKTDLPLILLANQGWNDLSYYDALYNPNILWIQKIDIQTLISLYQHAQAFFFPSLDEGFGKPPIEALSAGCPVSISNITAHREVYRDVPYYFDPKSIESMIKAIEHFSNLDFAKQQQKIQIEKFKLFESIYYPENISQKWQQLIEKVHNINNHMI